MTEHLLAVEYEATFIDISIDDIRNKISAQGGTLIKPKLIQKRTMFHFPKGHEIEGGYIRVRDESGKITMTLKLQKKDGSIEGQKEIELSIDNYENAQNFLKIMGATEKAIHETYREIWHIDDSEIMIDWWPFLDPIIEIEGKSESAVKSVAEKLELNWNDAIFDSIDHVYNKKYNISFDRINNHTPKIVFDMENPFID